MPQYNQIDESVLNNESPAVEPEPHVGAEDLDIPLNRFQPEPIPDPQPPVTYAPPPEVQVLLEAKKQAAAPNDKDKIDRLSNHDGDPEDRLKFLEEEFAELLVRLHLHGI